MATKQASLIVIVLMAVLLKVPISISTDVSSITTIVLVSIDESFYVIIFIIH